MTLLRTSNIRAALASLALAGCRMDNPAFGDDELGASESAGETLGTSDAGESGSSTSDATTTATSDPSTDTTSDATTDTSDSTEGSEGIEPDMMGENVCDAIFAPPYPVVYGEPEVFDGNACPAAIVDHFVKVTGPGPDVGLVMVQRCPNGCGDGCDGESYAIGVVGLSNFWDPIVDLAVQQNVCLRVQTGPSYGLDDARCGYASMWIGGVQPSTLDLLVAQHQPGQLPVTAGAAFNGHPPPALGADKTVCTCETAFANQDADVACCLDSMLETYSSTLVFAGSEVKPDDEAVVDLGIGQWRFSVAQAQKYPACDVEPLGVSWALAREL